MNSSPLVSVIMPVYNEERFIARAIESILEQTYNNIELIIIDDYSTDKSVEIANEYLNKDNRVRIYKKNGEPRRAGISRNIGINISKGEYICFQDADDYCQKERIELQLKKALEKPGLNFVGCWIEVIENDKKYIKEFPVFHDEIISGFRVERGRGKFFVMGTALAPVSFFKNNPSKEILRYVEDWDQLIRISENEKVEFYNIPQPLYSYNYIGGLSEFKKGWIKSNLFVRFSQRMRRKGLRDPYTYNELTNFLLRNFSELFLYLSYWAYYKIKSIFVS